mmetsp:Transcript_60437/g.70684  ORF Transcript_60437/g.70684 Transcript_60437/m.70684 type:complete len:240 (+) Transcript_60437:654-1373(+)
MILAIPTIRAFQPESISNPIKPEVGRMNSRFAAGAIVAMVWNSNSPQNIVCGISIPRRTITEPPKSPRYTAREFTRRPILPNTSITLKCKLEKHAATPAPSRPINAPVNTSTGLADASVGFAIIQMDPIGRPDSARKTTRQTSPLKIASTVCSKYSMPNLEFTSRAKRLPPRGLPKKAARAPAIPINVCFLTTLRLRCLKTRRDTNPPSAAQIATRGASGPRLPPPRIENILAQTIGTT